jgi:Cu-Zn family superoxide dismutase
VKKWLGIGMLCAAMAVFATGCWERAASGQLKPGSGLQAGADLRNARGDKVGTAVLTQEAAGVRIVVQASGLEPGRHGIHFHETGVCEVPDFQSAGAHFNPDKKKHGLENPLGPHAGDLPNLEIGADGTGRAEFITRLVTLEPGKANSLVKAGGTALVVHDRTDDQKTDPSGNSGGRIACGVIVAAGK